MNHNPNNWGAHAPAPKTKSSTAKKVLLGTVVGAVTLIGGALALDTVNSATEVATKPTTSASVKVDPVPKTEKPKGHAPEDDVTASLSVEYGYAQADIVITNHSSDESNYVVWVELLDSKGNRVGQTFTATNNLVHGKSFKTTAAFFVEAPPNSTVKVTDVTRYASF